MTVADDLNINGVTLGEIVRTLNDVREEIRALRSEHVRRDLYEAHRATVAAEMARIERTCADETAELRREIQHDREGRDGLRRAVTVAVIACAVSFVLSLILNLAT